MTTFSFRARNLENKKETGVLTAESSRQARQKLRDRGLRIEWMAEKRPQVLGTFGWLPRRTRHRTKLTVCIRELSTLLQAGIPLLAALDSLVAQTSGAFGDCLVEVRDKVAGGCGLAESMAGNPTVFDQMTIGMLEVGEQAGNLDEVCEQLAVFRERSSEMADRVLSAILYPAIVLAVSVFVTLFLMTAVVPMLLSNLIEMGRPLPWPTRVLKFLSDGLLSHGWWIGLVIALLLAGGVGFLQTQHGKRLLAKVALRLPVIGALVQKQSLSRMSLIVASLLRSGVELVDALEIAERSSTNVLLKDALRNMRTDLEAGRGMRDAMERHSIFSHSLCQVFSLGQQSGKLETMLERMGRDYDRQTATLSTRFASILEPILILTLAVVVGFVLFATVLPILEAGNVLAE